MMRMIILDTETTGLSPTQGHRIIEVGAVEMVNRRFTGRTFHYYLHPDREIDPGAQAVHGITLDFLADKPRFHEIAKDLKDFLADSTWIIHNAPFDLGFLDSEYQKLDDSHWFTLKNRIEVIDTLKMARQMHPGQRNNLDALCKRYGIDNSKRDKHGALLDAEILADLYRVMTGGQDELLLDENQTSKKSTTKTVNTTDKPATAIQEGKVIKATSEELKAHEAMCQLLT